MKTYAITIFSGKFFGRIITDQGEQYDDFVTDGQTEFNYEWSRANSKIVNKTSRTGRATIYMNEYPDVPTFEQILGKYGFEFNKPRLQDAQIVDLSFWARS